MAVLKWLFAVVFGIAGLGALGLGVIEGSAPRVVVVRSAPLVMLREFPAGGALAAAAPTTDAPTPAPAKEDDEAPAPLAKLPESPPTEETPPKVEEKPAPVVEKPVPVVEKPAPAVEKPAPVAEKPRPPPPAPVADGVLNLRASDTADVYLDGKKLGGSPLMGVKAKVGNHKIRFDCYDAAGNTVPGTAQTIVVKAEGETEFEFTCPTE